jgi:nucleotide-binding universal stress UspA family protein
VYERILLAYDGSAEGRKALREGALLAKRCGAKIFLLSVIAENAGMGIGDGQVACQQDVYQKVFDEAVAKIKALGYEAEARLVCGEPAQQIGAYAKQINADLVVVGHRKRNLIERWWSGSTGAYLVDNVHCTLLIARSNISDEAFEAEFGKIAEPVGA